MAQNEKHKLTIYQKIEKFGDLVILNVLFVISCIPIFTIGAAISAVYSFTLKLVNDEEPPVVKGYFKAFRDNFKQATQAWLIVLAMLAVLYVEFSLSYSLSGIGLAAMLALMAIEMIYLSFTLPLLFPLIVRYENTLGNMFKNAFLLNISNLGTWFYLFFIWVIPIALYLSNSKILYYTWTLWILLWVALLAYACSMVIDKLFRKIEGREDENEDETTTKKTSFAGSDNSLIESESAIDIKTADEKAKTERKNNEKLKHNTENNVESSIKDNKKNNTKSTAKKDTKGNTNNQKKSISEILEKTSNK